MVSASRRAEFEALFLPQADRLFGFSLRMTQDPNDAEDLLQESVYLAFRSFGSFRRGTNFRAWMFRIVTNAFISLKRREKHAPRPVEDLEHVQDPADAAQREFEDGETDWAQVYGELVDDDMKRALDELPEEFRGPLLLTSLGGLSYKEISDVLGVPMGTVMSRLFRARQRLRRSLKDYAVERGIVPEGSDQ
jgi:RNA polymerase sigma-70 factor (ECF subfamily)